LLSTFLKSYARPFLGISPPAPGSAAKNGDGDAATTDAQAFPELGTNSVDESGELVEPEIRDRFKRMCEGYFESVSKKLVLEHKVSSFSYIIIVFSD
jgi:regulator of nonsense transcripts 2